jgi:DNA-binding transcriptional ArsR family regulator
LDPLLASVLSHPRRQEILPYLMHTGESTSIDELAETIDLPSCFVEYHVKVLAGADLVTLSPLGLRNRRDILPTHDSPLTG